MDSIVLLSAMQKLCASSFPEATVRAVHVNHGLQGEADQWQKFCASTCSNFGIELHCEKIDLGSDSNISSGIENRAREARYRVFESQLQADEVLLLAHHLDDQLETLLFRLNRGASLKGLAAIPQRRQFAAGELFRPLLELKRSELHDYAIAERLEWIDDASNQDIQFDRNYLRQEILPAIETRWPNYRLSWHKSQQLIAEANEMLADLAISDLDKLQTTSSETISIEGLKQLSQARQRNAIRYWIERAGLPDLGWNSLQQLVNEFAASEKSAEGVFAVDGYSVGRFQDQLYLLVNQPTSPESLSWLPLDSPEITIQGSGRLKAKEVSGRGLAKHLLDCLDIRFRQGSESCQLQGRPTKSLKKLLQEASIEPWWRDRIPLIYRDNELICIPGIGIAETAAAADGEPGFELSWERGEA